MLKRRRKHSKIRKGNNLERFSWFKVGLVFLSISLAIFLIFLYFEENKQQSVTNGGRVERKTQKKTYEEPTIDRWKTYQNKEFGFSVKHPPILSTNEIGNGGGYIFFVRFEEEPQFRTNSKGVAVGVSALSLEQETERIKKLFEKEDGGLLNQETNVEMKGFTAKRLDYVPKDANEMEKRVVIITNRGRYTYSISTVPEQIDKVVDSFEFIK